MIISTRDFGNVEINEEDVITFTQPIFGFENLSKYVLLFNEEISDHFVWLQSLEDERICFILANPLVTVKEYRPSLPQDTQRELGEGEYLYWLVVVVADELKDSTVNLKSPIVVNPAKKRGVQVILEDNLPIRFPLLGEEGEDSK